jgi:hypothetical protein
MEAASGEQSEGIAGGEAFPQLVRRFDTTTFLFLLAAAVYLYGYLFVPPFTPILNLGDGLVYLGDAQRMWYGEVMYRDFFQFSTPGTALVYLALFKLFGLRAWIPNLALMGVGLGLGWLAVAIAQTVVRRCLALLPGAIFLVGVYRNLLDGTHHWYSLLAATGGLAVLIERRSTARVASAGALCGVAACFTQSRGIAVVAGFAVFLWWESRSRGEAARELVKKEIWLCGGFLASVVAVNGYFAWQAGLDRFLWCTVVFGLKYHHQQVDENSFRVITNDLPQLAWRSSIIFRLAAWLLIDVVVPFVPLFFFGYYWRRSKRPPRENWERPMLLAIAGLAMTLSVAPAPASIRTASSSLPGIVLLVWLVDSPRVLAQAVVGITSAGMLLLLPHGVARTQAVEREELRTSVGSLAIADRDTQAQYSWLLKHTYASDYVYGMSDPYFYFYLGLRNPTPLPLLTNTGYTRPAQVWEAIRGLETHRARYVVWSPARADSIQDWESPADNHLGPLRDYIRRYYHVAKVFENSEEVWERSAQALPDPSR